MRFGRAAEKAHWLLGGVVFSTAVEKVVEIGCGLREGVSSLRAFHGLF
jgi:hypothetical protein